MKIQLNFMLACLSLMAYHKTTAQQWEWAKGFGGSQSLVLSHSVATDTKGNTYIAGEIMGDAKFENVTVTTPPNIYQPYLAKYDDKGTLVWVYPIPISGGIYSTGSATGIALNPANGEIYVTGYFSGKATFGNTAGSLQTISQTPDGFIAKYSNDGLAIWATALGKIGPINNIHNTVKPAGIAVDATGDCYVTGSFTGLAAFGLKVLTSSPGMPDIFACGYNANGNMKWALQSGGDRADTGTAICIDLTIERCYITGQYSSSPMAFGTTAPGNNNPARPQTCFIWSIGTKTGTHSWAKSASSPSNSGAYSCGTGIAANTNTKGCFVTGYFKGSVFFDNLQVVSTPPGPQITTATTDMFLVRYNHYNNVGGVPVWALQEGGEDVEEGNGVCFNPATNEVYATGFFRGKTKFNNGAYTVTNPTSSNSVFVSFYDAATGSLEYLTRSSGVNKPRAGGIATNGLAKSAIYVTGQNSSATDMFFNDSFSGPSGLSVPGTDNWQTGFVAKLNPTVSNRLGDAAVTDLVPVARNFSLYPNPASNTVNVSISPSLAKTVSQISLINLLGQEVISIEPDHAENIAINVSGIANGTYIISLKTNDKTITQKLLVRH